MRQKMIKMKPICLPRPQQMSSPTQEKKDKSKDDVTTLEDLNKRLGQLRNKINTALTSTKIIDLNNPKQGQSDDNEVPAFVATSKVANRALMEKQLRHETEEITNEITQLMASRTPGGQIKADFTQFPSPLMSKALMEKDCKMVARIKLAPKAIKSVPLIVAPHQLRQIHQTVLV